MVSQTTTNSLLFVVLFIVEISDVICSDTIRKCCASDEGLERISALNKYVCTSDFKENILPLKFNDLNMIEFGIPPTCGEVSCIDKTSDGRKVVELLCDTQEKKSTREIPIINKCCPWNSTFNSKLARCTPSNNSDETDYQIFDIESQVYNLIINSQPKCDPIQITPGNFLYDDYTFNNGKLTIHYEIGGTYMEKETYCFDLHQENYQKRVIVRFCAKFSKENFFMTKCCQKDELLQYVDNKYECTNNVSKVLPLQLNERVNVGIPNICANETCIDKKIDQTIVELFCKKKNKTPPIQLPTIYKCCPANMFYDDSTKSCTEDITSVQGLIFDSIAPMYNLIFGAPNCQKSMAVVDYTHEGKFKIINGTLVLNNSKSFANGTYCIDRRRANPKMYIRACEYAIDTCRDRPCVPKCCAPSQTLLKRPNVKSVCVEDFTTPFYTNFTNSTNEDVGMPENMPIISSVLHDVDCKRYAVPNFLLYENGSLYAAKTLFRGIDQRYCVEYLTNGNDTNYVALLCFPKPVVSGLHHFYYLAGLLISIIFLAITLTIYFFLPDLQNLHGRTVMSHSTSLLAAYIILAMVKRPLTQYKPATCQILGYGIMYTFLAAFAWLNVMCFDIWYTFGVVKAPGLKKRNDLKKFLLYSLYAYGFPLILTGITLYIDLFAQVPEMYKPNFARDACWFDLRPGENVLPYSIFFAMPVALIIFFNIVLFILTVRHCLKVRGDIQRMQHADSPKKRRFFTDKATLIMNFKLFIVMGISWIFEIMSMYIREPIELWYLLDSLNVLQGLWIFCIFVLKDNVWKALRKKLGYHVIREGSQTQSTVLSAKNSVVSTTSLRVNGTTKPEEKDLLHVIRNSAGPMNGNNSKASMLK